MIGTTPCRDAKDAFKAVLDTAVAPGVRVFRDQPYEGVKGRAVVLTLVSGSSSAGAIGLRETPTQRALGERYRIQIDCYHEDPVQCALLTDKVAQAIADADDTLRSTYGIEVVGKLVHTQVGGREMVRETRYLLDFEFSMLRAVS